MKELNPLSSHRLRPARTWHDREYNIHTLVQNGHIHHLLMHSDHRNVKSLFLSHEAVPRSFEEYLVVGLEKKRTLISDFLFTLHQNHPRLFTLGEYLRASKKVFHTITQYRYSHESITFALETIIAYISQHAPSIPRSIVIKIVRSFPAYDSWTLTDIEIFLFRYNLYDIMQAPINAQVSISKSNKKNLSIKRYAQDICLTPWIFHPHLA